MSDIPTYITHYHLPGKPPFLNLSDLDEPSLVNVLSDLAAGASGGRSHRRFGPRYMGLREATETLMRGRFIERGGKPQRSSPHYFVLGESEWFRGLYRDAAEVRVSLADLPADQVSFTSPDSITSMGLLKDFGIEPPTRPYHGECFRIDELEPVIAKWGRPNSAEPASYDGHQFQDFEHYIEVQVWSDQALGI